MIYALATVGLALVRHASAASDSPAVSAAYFTAEFSRLHTQMCGMLNKTTRQISDENKAKLENVWANLESEFRSKNSDIGGFEGVQSLYHDFLLSKATQSLGDFDATRLCSGRMGTIFEVSFPPNKNTSYGGKTLALKLPSSFTKNEEGKNVWELWCQEIELYNDIEDYKKINKIAKVECDALIKFHECVIASVHAESTDKATYILMEQCDKVEDYSSIQMMYDCYRAIGHMHKNLKRIHGDIFEDNCMKKDGTNGHIVIDYLSLKPYTLKNMEADILAIKNMCAIGLRRKLSMKIINWTKTLNKDERKMQLNKKICQRFKTTPPNPFSGKTSYVMPGTDKDFYDFINENIINVGSENKSFPKDLYEELQTYQTIFDRFQKWYPDACKYIDSEVNLAKAESKEKRVEKMAEVSDKIVDYLFDVMEDAKVEPYSNPTYWRPPLVKTEDLTSPRRRLATHRRRLPAMERLLKEIEQAKNNSQI